MSEYSERPDYVWHFKLSGDAAEGAEADALTEMVRRQLRALLRCVTLKSDGVDLKVTGFSFLGEPEREHAVYPELAKRRLGGRRARVAGR